MKGLSVAHQVFDEKKGVCTALALEFVDFVGIAIDTVGELLDLIRKSGLLAFKILAVGFVGSIRVVCVCLSIC